MVRSYILCWRDILPTYTFICTYFHTHTYTNAYMLSLLLVCLSVTVYPLGYLTEDEFQHE